ncbi:hypothetical protein P8932_12095 [Bacillus atrophaeus]|nr:hypothetical protein [Bacillus atrophaeus]
MTIAKKTLRFAEGSFLSAGLFFNKLRGQDTLLTSGSERPVSDASSNEFPSITYKPPVASLNRPNMFKRFSVCKRSKPA